MPARIVPPSASLWAGDDGGGPLDLEGKFRRAVRAALADGCSGGSLEEDVLEALCCAACDAADAGGETLRSALEAAAEDAGLVAGPCREAVLEALTAVAAEEASAGDATLPTLSALVGNRATLRIPSAGGAAGRWQRRRDVELDRAREYLVEQRARAAKEIDELAARERELHAFYGGAGVEPATSSTHRLEPPSGGGGSRVAGAVADRSATGAVSGSDSSDEEEDELTTKDREATKRRLRELGEPATLFAENDEARHARLRRCELTRDQNELATGSTNVMQILDRRAEREMPKAIRDHVMAPVASSSPRAAAAAGVPMEEDRWNVDADLQIPEEDPEDAALDPGESDEVDANVRVVAMWLRNSLRDWEAWLQDRQKDEQGSAAFMAEKARFRQSRQYLRPLRRSLRDGSISKDIITSLADVARCCSLRDYKAAKEAYMRLAIGNAAWPMGVTMVTFHDRAARAGISEGAIAHVLDDETTRKYVQMVKRLCTFCEARWPIDPSRAA